MEEGHGGSMLTGLGLDRSLQSLHSRLLPFATTQPQPQPSDPGGGRGNLTQQIGLAFPAAAYGRASSRGKQLPSPDVEPAFGEDGAAAKRPSPSPWHRMKWTDGMVRLLVMVVYCMGDDDGDQPAAAATKSLSRKATAPGALQLQQQQQQQQQKKKGKWRSVSRAMMEKGFFVSPQQCEDKFNDLNKRYKRVNDLLGKGTACRVVENHALLDTMDHLSPKAKEEARKLLNSKHLFFREMCAYHNGGGGSTPAGASSNVVFLPSPLQDQRACVHHSLEEPARSASHQINTTNGDADTKEEDEDDYNDDYNDDEDEEEDDDDDHFEEEDDSHHKQHANHREDYDDEDSKGFGGGGTASTCSATKRRRGSSLPQQQPASSASPPLSLSLFPPAAAMSMQQLTCELAALAGRGEEQQQRQWLKKKAVELQENRVGYQSRSLQLERQRFKWLRFISNKENEMERMKLDNERFRLENDRMLLLLRQKELELMTGSGSGGGGAQPLYSS